MELNDYEGAGKCLHTALKLEPENTKIMSNMGFLALEGLDVELTELTGDRGGGGSGIAGHH